MPTDELPAQPLDSAERLGMRPSFEPPAQPPPLESRPLASLRTRPRFRSRPVALAVTAFVLVFVCLPVGWRVGVLEPLESASAATAAQDAVRGFLEALVAGDATAALSYAATAPADSRMLTDEVLARSLANNPLGGVQVLGSTGSTTYQLVQALYRLGGREVGASFDVLRLGDEWLLQSVSAMADLNRLRARALGSRLNGVTVLTDEPDLFIGTYTVTTSDDRFAITDSTFSVESVRAHPNTTEISVNLSDEGVAAVREAATAKLAACLTMRKLAPAGCGFRVPTSGSKPREQTITWQADDGARDLEILQVTLTIDDPATARGEVRIMVRATYSTADGSVRQATSSISEVHVVFRNNTTEVTFVSRE